MKKQIRQMKEFYKKFNIHSSSEPKLILNDRAIFRIGMLREEIDELEEAHYDNDIVSIADAIVDTMYALIGTAHEYGIADKLPELFDEIHRSNMTKTGGTDKLIKGKDYKPPFLGRIIGGWK